MVFLLVLCTNFYTYLNSPEFSAQSKCLFTESQTHSSWKGSLGIESNTLLKQDPYSRLCRKLSQWILNVCRDGDSTVSLGRLFQCSVTLTVKFFLVLVFSVYKSTPLHLWVFFAAFCLFVLTQKKKNKNPTKVLLLTYVKYVKYFINCPRQSLVT